MRTAMSNYARTWQVSKQTFIMTSICIIGFFLVFGLLFKSETGDLTLLVIPGGGQTDEGKVPLHTQLRLDRAVEIYRLSDSRNIIFVTLSGGTPHKPNPIDKDGFPIFEATSASRRLIEMGIPADHIWEENFSLDTIGNAYFLRTIHTDVVANIQKIVIITNDWHMDRTRDIFNYIFALPKYRIHGIKSKKYSLFYETVGSALEPTSLQSRKVKEKASLLSFQEDTKHEFACMLDLHQWIFTKHSAYASSRHSKPRPKVNDAALLKSY
jgi:uncharacterized SAM-binding protein YcdF (DUF218 family)